MNVTCTKQLNMFLKFFGAIARLPHSGCWPAVNKSTIVLAVALGWTARYGRFVRGLLAIDGGCSSAAVTLITLLRWKTKYPLVTLLKTYERVSNSLEVHRG